MKEGCSTKKVRFHFACKESMGSQVVSLFPAFSPGGVGASKYTQMSVRGGKLAFVHG